MRQTRRLLKIATISALLCLPCFVAVDSTAQTWSAPINLTKNAAASTPSIAIDPSGNLHVVWTDGNSIFYRNIWSEPIKISKNAGQPEDPVIAEK